MHFICIITFIYFHTPERGIQHSIYINIHIHIQNIKKGIIFWDIEDDDNKKLKIKNKKRQEP